MPRAVAQQTRYARSGDVHIAYQVVGDGPLDLVWIPSLAHHVELNWENPAVARWLSSLQALARLIAFDKRGTGMSDRVSSDTTLETRMDDIRAVMDAARSDRAVLCALGDGGPLAMLFAATYPDRTAGLVLINTVPRFVRSADFPWLSSRAEYEQRIADLVTAAVRKLGLEVRAGLHTGECELVDGKVGGIAVHIGARVASQAAPGEVLVSSTVKDLVAGSGITFVDRGAAELKGLLGEWRLFAVEEGAA